MINVIKKPSNNFGERNGYKPEIVVIHISTGTLASMDSWFAAKASLASAHYSVARDGTISQYVDESKAAWANGRMGNPSFKLFKGIAINPNQYTISIENEGQDLSNGTPDQFNALSALLIDICGRNNIPIDRDHIIGHYEIDSINRPFCPSPDHSIMDKIVSRIHGPAPEEMIPVMVPKSKLELVTNFINSLN